MSTKGNITLCLTSLAAGAVLGLLLAPASGRDTRRNLVRRGEEMKDKLNDLYEEGSQYISRNKDKFADVADRAKDRAETTAQEVKGAASRAASNVGSTARSASTNGGSRP
jgi:gas vesicle protein